MGDLQDVFGATGFLSSPTKWTNRITVVLKESDRVLSETPTERQ
jgi:hypothetical protein